ncbi:MFS general substrate transporter [Rhizoctonia solani 123E]|uniref:MFS general substrate transporter n=1 Tax=Rhizoctonia solani 123E TaxID=1423351 RepID=A0A074SE86_9AGAM|nr:MFS general substrate transporter [Rhizoctonia solani 123E]
MESSTLTLPANALSALPNASRTSFPRPPESGVERPSFPSRRHLNDQEAIEMSTLGEKPLKAASASSHPEIPAWTMSTKSEWIAIMACCGCMFVGGWNDATTGPLLPTIQEYYGVNFTIVSMLFVSGCIGFISAAVVNIHLTDRLGFGKVIFLGGILQVLAYSLLAPALPFPVMCIAHAINGFGMALQDAQSSGFIAELPNNASAKMGLLHASYGAGAFLSPLVATQFAQLPRWSFHYLTSLGVAVANAIVLLVVFKFRRQHEVMGLPDPNPSHAHDSGHGDSSNNGNKYKQIFGSRAVQLMAFFIWVYVGVEVTIGGWIVTFVIEERGGGPSAGYISSGFFAGIMLGRVVLLWVNEKIGERRVIYLYCVLCIALELVIWLVPNIIGNAVAVSIVGLLLGEWNQCLYMRSVYSSKNMHFTGYAIISGALVM